MGEICHILERNMPRNNGLSNSMGSCVLRIANQLADIQYKHHLEPMYSVLYPQQDILNK